MKNLINLLCVGVLTSALGVACDKPDKPEIITVDPNADCWVFVTTIPGEETILLAKSGLGVHEAFEISADFESKYGKENVMWSVGYSSAGANKDGKDYIAANPDAVTNCYEITMTIEFDKSSVPSVKSLLGYGFRAVRINGNTAICKRYGWAINEEVTEGFIQRYEDLYNDYGKSKYAGKDAKGTIIGISTVKKLGPEVHDTPVMF